MAADMNNTPADMATLSTVVKAHRARVGVSTVPKARRESLSATAAKSSVHVNPLAVNRNQAAVAAESRAPASRMAAKSRAQKARPHRSRTSSRLRGPKGRARVDPTSFGRRLRTAIAVRQPAAVGRSESRECGPHQAARALFLR